MLVVTRQDGCLSWMWEGISISGGDIRNLDQSSYRESWVSYLIVSLQQFLADMHIYVQVPPVIFSFPVPDPLIPHLSTLLLFTTTSAHKLAFPLLSNGNTSTNTPAAMNSAPLTYTGALVSKSANMATIGAMMPKMRFADAVIAFPVPLSLVGKISGVYEYSTAYMILLMKLNAQFHPSRASEVSAVVEP